MQQLQMMANVFQGTPAPKIPREPPQSHHGLSGVPSDMLQGDPQEEAKLDVSL